VAAIHEQIAKAARSPDLKEKFAAQGLDLVGNTPDEFADYLRKDFALWDKVIKSSGIKVD
jgi:tripartite-type tricarboxylate transporter receptor subunit TctC